MKKPLVLLVMVCLFEFVAAQQCDLEVAQSWFKRFTNKIKKWYNYLKRLVLGSDEPDCQHCDSIRPPGQKVVQSERDSRVGCHCNHSNVDVFQCACCFKVLKFDVLFCSAVGFILHSETVFFVVTIENFVIVKFNFSLEGKLAKYAAKLLQCIPLPPPIEFLSACFRPSIESPTASNNNTWKFCGKLRLGVLQVPAVTLYMKCFEIGEKQDALKIEGQSDPRRDVANPARGFVQEKNYNAFVCLSNTQKRDAMQGRLPKPSVENAGRTNWREAKLGETPAYLAVLHQRAPIPTDELTGDDKFPQIKAAMKRAESERWSNRSESSIYEPNTKFCGAALLTRNRVLTICACVRTFYIANKLQRLPNEDDVYPFDIQSIDIYLDITGITFTGAYQYSLDKDPEKFMSKSLCARNIEYQEDDRRILRDAQYANNTWNLQTLMMVVAFEPDITDPSPGQFVRWPPHLVRPRQAADMIAFGMEKRNWSWIFRNSSGGEINFESQAVRYFFEQCTLSNDSTSPFHNKLVFDAVRRVTGFCSRQHHSQLCYGKIGFPLVAEGELLALSSLPVDCDIPEGSIVGAIFDPVTIYEIETYLGINSSCLNWAPHIMWLASMLSVFLWIIYNTFRTF